MIYANDSEKDLRRYAENLERYHSAMEYITRRKSETPSPSNRVVIFVVGNSRKLQKLAGGGRFIQGFYVPRAGASRAFVQNIRNKNGYPDFSTIVLLHEYAHHFLISSNRFAMPQWMSEGAAEFFAATTFKSDGSVLIGQPANHRGRELAFANKVPIRELLDYELYQENKGKGYDAFYGRSWLLYHYMIFNKERTGQLNNYWRSVVEGEAPLDAAQNIFGDLDTLERELDAYQKQRRMFTFNLPPERLNASAVSLRRLPKGEAEMMDVRIRSQRGVNRKQAEELVIEAREIAAQYPKDAGVQAALAEAEYDAGNDDLAIAAADAAIAADPTRVNAYVQKGFALFRKAEEIDDDEALNAAYRQAMKPFEALNKIENDHPLPLIYYHRSYTDRGEEPPQNARNALERAAQLAPFDKGLWFQVAFMQMEEGRIASARRSLQPLAADPHGGAQSERVKTLLAALENLPEGEPVDMRGLASERDDGDVADSADTADTADETPENAAP